MGPRFSEASSVKAPSVAAGGVTSGSVASWLTWVDTSHAANSLVDEEDATSIANYSNIAGFGNNRDHETPKAPRASILKNTGILLQKQQTPTSLLDMDDVTVPLTTSTTPLSPKAFFSNTILSGTAWHAASSASLMSFETDDSWQRTQRKKSGPNQSQLDDPKNGEELIPSRSSPYGTFMHQRMSS